MLLWSYCGGSRGRHRGYVLPHPLQHERSRYFRVEQLIITLIKQSVFIGDNHGTLYFWLRGQLLLLLPFPLSSFFGLLILKYHSEVPVSLWNKNYYASRNSPVFWYHFFPSPESLADEKQHCKCCFKFEPTF